jgi:hypothetical protein
MWLDWPALPWPSSIAFTATVQRDGGRSSNFRPGVKEGQIALAKNAARTMVLVELCTPELLFGDVKCITHYYLIAN